MTSFIDLQIDKHVAVVTMDAPLTRNALSSDEQYGAIEEVCKRLSGDPLEFKHHGARYEQRRRPCIEFRH